MTLRRIGLACAFALAAGASALADDKFTIGIMNDQSGVYADLSGPTGVIAMKLAIEDFGG